MIVVSLTSAVASRVVDAATERALGLVDLVLQAQITSAAVDRVLSSPLLRRSLDRALAGPVGDAVLDAMADDGLVERILGDPAAERLVAHVIDSRVMDTVSERLLASDEFWQLIENIAASPAVTAAISRQGAGLADEFAEVVRERSARADDRVEGALQRLVGRRRAARATRAEPTT
jgi:hypothetical protein